MGIPKPTHEKYTYADYLTWSDDVRWEIIDGTPYNMSPAPNRKHQTISGALFNVFYNYLKNHKCEVYAAPFDIRFFTGIADNETIDTVVQPDISIFCDLSKLDEKGAIGSPDLAVEILSPSTAHKDLNIKLLLYQKYKVNEYWIIDPDSNKLFVYNLDSQGRYELIKEYSENDKVKPGIFSDLEIGLAEIFEVS